MTAIIRTDISRILFLWAFLGLGVWLATPWGTAISTLIGPAWLWCGVIPGVTAALLYPRSLARSAVRGLWLLTRLVGRLVSYVVPAAAGALADCVSQLHWRSP